MNVVTNGGLPPSAELAFKEQGRQSVPWETARAELGAPDELRAKFQQFVAGNFYRTMLQALRKTTSNKGLIHGGRAEEIFRSQLDQTIADRFATAHGAALAEKMYEQFTRRLNDTTAPPKGSSDDRSTSDGLSGPNAGALGATR